LRDFFFLYPSSKKVKTAQYYIVYKPYRVLSQFSPVEGKHTLKDFFKTPADVYPVGRLDYDSEGLLILTSDATLNQQLLQPQHGHEREYYAQVEGLITEQALQLLRRGLTIRVDGRAFNTKPCGALLLQSEPDLPPRFPPVRFRKLIPTSWMSITLTEGKNRQVRKMLAATGFPVLRLVRRRIAGVTVAGMQPGDMIQMSRNDLYELLFGKAARR
jgi:23S rRNA pseudouridine2457 synthase